MWKLRAKQRHLYLPPSSNCVFEPRQIQSAPHWLTTKFHHFFFFIKWIAPEGVLHLPRSENVLLHVLNRRSSPAAPPSLSPSLWHNSSRACFNVSHDEDDKSVVAGERRLKNGLNYPLCRGYVCSRCVVFITPMFTFISTCLKCVTILFSPPAAPPTPRSWYPLGSVLQTDAIKQRKCFVCLPLAEAQGWVKTSLVSVHGRYHSFKRGHSAGMCISLPFPLKGHFTQITTHILLLTVCGDNRELEYLDICTSSRKIYKVGNTTL